LEEKKEKVAYSDKEDNFIIFEHTSIWKVLSFGAVFQQLVVLNFQLSSVTKLGQFWESLQ
jgi:hypothetical protein